MNHESNNLKIFHSAICGTISAIIFIAAAAILGELFSPFKDFLKNTFTHHWIGKSGIASAIFVVLSFLIYFLPFKIDENKLIKCLNFLILTAIFGSLAILGFFIFEFMR